jgi:hypothetical protein
MGYGGKVVEREAARRRRVEGATYAAIATELGVAISTVSNWCRDIEPQVGAPARVTHPFQDRAERDSQAALTAARALIGTMSERDLLLYGIGLYHGEGAKSQGVRMANTSPAVLLAFVAWLRTFFEIDEARLHARLHLHECLDLEAATSFWASLLSIDADRFHAPHRPQGRPDQRIKHPFGCASVVYSSASLHRRVMALIEAVSSSIANPG